MKKTLSLLGLLFAGVALLASPQTGILAASDPDTVTTTVVTTTTLSGDPPVDDTASGDEAIDGDAATTTTVDETTTTASTDTGRAYSVTGSAEQSRFGTFQVEVTFEDGQIVAIDTLQAPGDRKSQSINSRAIPSYEAAILAAQSADIDAMSGATITWESYTASVQSALDAAGFTG